MKTRRILLIAITVLCSVVYTKAQTITGREGFVIKASNTLLTIPAKSDLEMDITILRSKRYKDANIELSLPNLPKGISFKVNQNSVNPNFYHLTFSAEGKVKSGSYAFVLYGSHPTKKKGIVLSLTIPEPEENLMVSTGK